VAASPLCSVVVTCWVQKEKLDSKSIYMVGLCGDKGVVVGVVRSHRESVRPDPNSKARFPNVRNLIFNLLYKKEKRL
jgi:hypothetical protein